MFKTEFQYVQMQVLFYHRTLKQLPKKNKHDMLKKVLLTLGKICAREPIQNITKKLLIFMSYVQRRNFFFFQKGVNI